MTQPIDYGGKQPSYWAAFRFTNAKYARRAWEKCEGDAQGYSVWRLAEPMKPPHRSWIVIALGEDERQVAVAERRIKSVQKAGKPESRPWPYTPDEEFLLALIKRRVRQALSALKQPNPEAVFTNEGMNTVLQPDGTMKPAAEVDDSSVDD